jgi:hypothetical protein
MDGPKTVITKREVARWELVPLAVGGFALLAIGTGHSLPSHHPGQKFDLKDWIIAHPLGNRNVWFWQHVIPGS